METINTPQNDVDPDRIRAGIRSKYRSVARTGTDHFNYPTGRAGLEVLNYDPNVLDNFDEEFLASFCGVGNPFQLEIPEKRDAVLDVGCGTGVDLAIAARHVGESGTAAGIDRTREMVTEARRSLSSQGATPIYVAHAGAESLPFYSRTFNRVFSNGVLNLSPFKNRCYREIHRVLKPGGVFQCADIVLDESAMGEIEQTPDAWSD